MQELTMLCGYGGTTGDAQVTGYDAAGNRYYRAYFTADFFWHSALAYELGKFELPPRNPYLAPRVMNYYWTYFLLPSTTARLAPSADPGGRDVQPFLKAKVGAGPATAFERMRPNPPSPMLVVLIHAATETGGRLSSGS